LAQDKNNDAQYWKDQLDELQDALESANENGLLKDNAETYKKIMDKITGALTDLSGDAPKTTDARNKYSTALQELNKHANSASFWWRFSYLYAGPALVYLLGLFTAILLLWGLFQPVLLNLNVLWVPSWAFLWGALGGILYGFWWLWQHASKRDFRKVWYVWYILLPIMGAILGALAYLIFVAGLISTTGEIQIKSQSFIMLLSGLAGFSARWMVQMLDKITKMIKIGE